MPILKVYANSGGGFKNSLSGVYQSETFNSAKTSSSSNLNQNTAEECFDTTLANLNVLAPQQSVPLLTGAKITAIRWAFYCTLATDINFLGSWPVYWDVNNKYGNDINTGSLVAGWPTNGVVAGPILTISDFTVGAYNFVSWSAAALAQFRTDVRTNVIMDCGMGSSGNPVEVQWYAQENVTNIPYLELTYTPASFIQRPNKLRPKIYAPGKARFRLPSW